MFVLNNSELWKIPFDLENKNKKHVVFPLFFICNKKAPIFCQTILCSTFFGLSAKPLLKKIFCVYPTTYHQLYFYLLSQFDPCTQQLFDTI